MPLLDMENLSVEFNTGSGLFRAVDGVSLKVGEAEFLAINLMGDGLRDALDPRVRKS